MDSFVENFDALCFCLRQISYLDRKGSAIVIVGVIQRIARKYIEITEIKLAFRIKPINVLIIDQ